jgi:hypothetical protein
LLIECHFPISKIIYQPEYATGNNHTLSGLLDDFLGLFVVRILKIFCLLLIVVIVNGRKVALEITRSGSNLFTIHHEINNAFKRGLKSDLKVFFNGQLFD